MIIKDIIDTFLEMSREHKLVRSFRYGRLSKMKGTGEESYPQVFLEDPIYIKRSSPMDGKVPVQVNFDITCLPHAFANYNVQQLTESDCQNVCHQIALTMISKLRSDSRDFSTRNGIDVDDYSFVTLRHWGDDDAAGIRCTLELLVDNDIQLCDIDEHFDPDKQFDLGRLLSDVNTDDAEACVPFSQKKLPNIKL